MTLRPILSWKFAHTLILVCGIYLTVLVVNDGFMALDEYWVGITRYIPSQTSSITSLVRADDVKSPLQILPMHLVASAALELGVTSPYWQYRSVIFVIGLINLALLLWAFLVYAKFRQYNLFEKNFLLLMLGFYFAAPFALTRPMFESLGAPWLCLAAVFALSYEKSSSKKDLIWGTFCASMAFVLRQQLGLCALVFVILPLLKKNWKDFFTAGLFGLVFFIISGIPDYFLRGQFHFSLINMFTYNLEHGSDYGRQPITFYPMLILAISFFPFFIAKYPAGFVRETLSKQKSLWWILFLFVFLHSLFPQKWERFVISIIPILILILEPFLYYFQQNFAQHRKRLISLYTLNGVLFFLASFFPPQKNLISMSNYLASNPGITRVYRINNTPEWITDAFILNKHYNFVEITAADIPNVDWKNCENALVLGKNQKKELDGRLPKTLAAKANFPVNLIEEITYKLNQAHNARRTELQLYGCRE